jgi:hypothetical protein
VLSVLPGSVQSLPELPGAAAASEGRHARILSRSAAQFWRVEELSREFMPLPRSGDTVRGFAAGRYPTGHPVLPGPEHEDREEPG